MMEQMTADCLRRAEEAREIAEGIFDDEKRQALLRIVDDFERLMLEESHSPAMAV